MPNTEHLKMILDAIGQTTDSAKWVLISWFSVDLLKAVFPWAGVALLAKIIMPPFIKAVSPNSFGVECRDIVLPRCAGTNLSDREKERVRSIIRLGLQAEAAGWSPPSKT